MRGAECAPVSAKRARRKDVGVVEDESVRKRKEGEGTAREEEEGGEKVKVIRGSQAPTAPQSQEQSSRNRRQRGGRRG